MNQNNKTISQIVKEKIKNNDIKPIPKWHFLLKHGFLWILLLILIIVAAVAVGVAIFEFSDVEWDLRPMLGIPLLPFIFRVFPYFWLLLCGAIAALAYFNFMATPKGYKFPSYQIVLFGILVIILTGTAFHYLGMTRGIRDRAFETPFINNFMHNKEAIWNMPENGLLAGVIIEYDQTSAAIRSFDGKDWIVNIEELKLPQNNKIEEGQKVKIIGKKTGDGQFKAVEARPWMKGDLLKMKEFFKKGGPKNQPPPMGVDKF